MSVPAPLVNQDTPSHILVPAIHKNRAESREIFLRTMPGADPGLTDDPRRLGMAARAHLRERFLRSRRPRTADDPARPPADRRPRTGRAAGRADRPAGGLQGDVVVLVA